MKRIAFFGLFCLLIGCQTKQMPKMIPLDEVDPSILIKAKEALPEVKFDNAVRKSDGGLEIRGKDPQGRIRDVDFSAKGAVVEIE